jgi:hypothetical protein
MRRVIGARAALSWRFIAARWHGRVQRRIDAFCSEEGGATIGAIIALRHEVRRSAGGCT